MWKVKKTRIFASMLLLGGILFAVSAAYAANSITVTQTMAIAGTGNVAVSCPISTACTISSITWGITTSATSAPTVTSVDITFANALSGTSSNSYTVYVTVYSSGTTVAATGSTTAAGAATTATVTLSPATVTPSGISSVEVDVVQTA